MKKLLLLIPLVATFSFSNISPEVNSLIKEYSKKYNLPQNELKGLVLNETLGEENIVSGTFYKKDLELIKSNLKNHLDLQNYNVKKLIYQEYFLNKKKMFFTLVVSDKQELKNITEFLYNNLYDKVNFDVGVAQINSMNIKHYNIPINEIVENKTNIEYLAKLYKNCKNYYKDKDFYELQNLTNESLNNDAGVAKELKEMNDKFNYEYRNEHPEVALKKSMDYYTTFYKKAFSIECYNKGTKEVEKSKFDYYLRYRTN